MKSCVGVLTSALGLFVLQTAVGASQVLVVEPGGAYSSFAAAYAVALDGDTILVKATPDSAPTNYGGLLIGSKNLTILGEPNSTGSLPRCSLIQVSDVGPTHSIRLRGFRLVPSGGSLASLQVKNNQGPVVLEDVHLPTNGLEAVNIIQSNSNLTLIRCSASGASSLLIFGIFLSKAGPALQITLSTVYAYDCNFLGGDGKTINPWIQPGGPGIDLENASFYACGGTIRGGDGGPGLQSGSTCTNGASGGAGIRNFFGLSQIQRLGVLLEGGHGGPAAACPGSQAGPDGPQIELNGGTSTVFAGVARSLGSNSPVRVGNTLHLQVKAPAGEVVFLAAAPEIQPVFVPALKGALLPALPFPILALPPIPGSGTLNLDFVIPPILPPGLPALNIAMQLLAAGTLGTGVVGAPTMVTILDSSL